MGGGQSSTVNVTSNLTNNIVNETTLKSLNKTVVNNASNTLINSASTCEQITDLSNLCQTNIRGGLSASGRGSTIDLTARQSNAAKINLSCIQSSSAATDMKTKMIEAVKNEIALKANNDIMAKLALAAAAEGTSGAGANLGQDQVVNSNTTSNTTNNVRNTFNQQIENVLEKNFSNNFSSDTVNKCLGRTSASNTGGLSVDGPVSASDGGVISGGCIQSNTVEQVTQCEALSEAVNKSLEDTAKDLGLQIKKDDKTGASTDSEMSATSTAVATGPIQDIGNAVSGVIDSVGGVFGNIAGGAALGAVAPFALSLCLCCCCCIISVIFFMLSSGGSSSSSSKIDLPVDSVSIDTQEIMTSPSS